MHAPLSNLTRHLGTLVSEPRIGGHPCLSVFIRGLRHYCCIALLLLAVQALGQTTPTNASPATNAAPPALEKEAERSWSFSASAYAYIVPNDREYVQPTIAADRGWLHLEARYNYEDLETGSAWVGCNFKGGDKLAWEFTPMLGGVFGNTTGIAPGYKGSLSWWKLELYSEGEYVFDTGDSSESFFYNWSELTLAPVDWFRFGLVTQRTRVYETERDVQRGVLVGFTWKRVNLTTYMFNPDDQPTWVFAVGLNF
jgi:hypothetical protein